MYSANNQFQNKPAANAIYTPRKIPAWQQPGGYGQQQPAPQPAPQPAQQKSSSVNMSAWGGAQSTPNAYATATPYASPKPKSSGTMQTMGGSFNDPRWAHNGGSWGDADAGITDRTDAGGDYGWSAAPKMRPPQQQVSGDPMGAYAGAAPGNRPPPFQMGPAQTPWGQSMDPFAERDAFLNQINQQRLQLQGAYNNITPFRPSTWGQRPAINFGGAMQGAGLGGGAPSMQPNYGDSLIGRLNGQFGGGLYQPQGGGLREWGDPSDPTGPYYQPSAGVIAWGDPSDPTGPNYDPSYTRPAPRGGWVY